MSQVDGATLQRFRAAYAEQRASEGRGYAGAEYLALPYLTHGPLARQWEVRARTFDAFMGRVLAPMVARSSRMVRVLDLGAGNGWLSYRAALAGCDAIALDVRDDSVDGLGAAESFMNLVPGRIERVAGSFESIPLGDASADVVVFNASLHYAVDLNMALQEARRVVRRTGRVVILDSPFYRRASAGDAMVEEKRRTAGDVFGANAHALLALPCIEYLTAAHLSASSDGLGLDWRRHRVSYPFWYEARAFTARVRGRRTPSRFDLWESEIQ
jgi:SAM-dependent methyltransferase